MLSLGGVAFFRQRRKKTLATALLKQTAQFNNNNPYAKLPEPAVAGGAGPDMAMVPTKPLGTFRVVATYTPALADEIEIGLGDSVTILQEYDDGWCMGVNNTRNGIKGVFPRHCVENNYDGSQHGGSQHGGPNSPGGPPGGFGSPKPQFMANKRMSSIAPQGQGWNQGYNNGPNGGFGPNYPPQPSPHYNGPNAGPIGPPMHGNPNHGGGGGYY